MEKLSKPKPMFRTVRAKITFDDVDAYMDLMHQYSDVFGIHTSWFATNDTFNKSRAHDALYAECREYYPNLPSGMIQTARDVAADAIKAWRRKMVDVRRENIRREKKTKARVAKGKRPFRQLKEPSIPRKRPTSSVRYDSRLMTLRGQQLTLSTLGKRQKCIINFCDHDCEITDSDDWKLVHGQVVYKDMDSQFYAHLVYSNKLGVEPTVDTEVVGIDRGVYNQAVTNDGRIISSSKTRAVQRRFLYTRKTLQAKGTRSAKRRLKKLSGKEKRFGQDVDHCTSKKLAALPARILVLEDLTGIRKRRSGKKMNKWLGSWTFSRLQAYLEYKAEAQGKQVVYINPAYTSRTCSACGHRNKNNRNRARFKCGTCGFQQHADINAACNIRDKLINAETKQCG